MRPFLAPGKTSLLLVAALMFMIGCANLNASRSVILTAWAEQNSANTSSQPAPRKTSKPYTGDLSIFETKDRDVPTT